MATLEVIIATAGVLGGAGITALGTALVQRSTRRSTEQKESLDRQVQARAQALEATVVARTASRSCALFLGHTLQDLEADRSIDIGLFDTTLRELLAEVNTAFFRMAATEADLVDTQPLANVRTSLTETSSLVRKVLLQKAAGQRLEWSVAQLSALVNKAATDVNLLMHSQAVHLRGSATPEVFSGSYTHPQTPEAPQAFPFPLLPPPGPTGEHGVFPSPPPGPTGERGRLAERYAALPRMPVETDWRRASAETYGVSPRRHDESSSPRSSRETDGHGVPSSPPSSRETIGRGLLRPTPPTATEARAMFPVLPPGAENPFWFTVPRQRQLRSSIGVPIPLEPGVWYLALSWEGDALDVLMQDGRRGLLDDTRDIGRTWPAAW
ncbi:hypothetical protein ACWCXX_34490 [Streptomyces sp. NPDC001732]